MARQHWAVMCRGTARTRGGRPCRRYAVRGGFWCPAHGGTSPQALLGAKKRLAAARLERQGIRLPMSSYMRAVIGGREERADFQRNLRTLLAEVRADAGSRT